jgi:hypothetical protein
VNARELAMELMQLVSRDRERLLAELPADRRAAMRDLIREAALVADGSVAPFETHLQVAESVTSTAIAKSPEVELARLNDGQLRILLSTEQPAVQQRVIKALRSGVIDAWPPAVRRVVLAWLQSHQGTSSIAAPEKPHSKARWLRWATWRKSA